MKYITAALALTLLVPAATSQSINQSTGTSQGTNQSVQTSETPELDLSAAKDAFNQRSSQLPQAASRIIGNENITLNIPEIEALNSSVYSIQTDGTNITSIERENTTSTTLEIWIEEENIEDLRKAERPVQKFGNMITSGDIRYETYQLSTKIKMTVITFLSGFL
jgi:hypothetical protein